MTLPRVGLIGASGYGLVHLEHLADLQRSGELALVGAVHLDRDRRDESEQLLRDLSARVFGSWDEFRVALPALALDLAIVPTPIHLHAAMAVALLEAGVHVLIEKPVAATVGEVRAIARAADDAQRLAAVGFQYLHAPEVQALKRRLVVGELGRLRRITAYAAWPRSHLYYTRNGWAGRLRAADGWVLDSPVANAMAHFFVLLGYFAGERFSSATRATRMTAELYRAQDIESFDTAALTLESESGCTLEFYGTHSSRRIARPRLTIEGEYGRAEWIQDRHARLHGRHGDWIELAAPEATTRERMLRDVLAHIRGEPRFVCDTRLAEEHVRCVDALHEFGRIVPLPAAALAMRDEGTERFTYVPQLDEVLATAAQGHTTLGAAGAPWAPPPVAMNLTAYEGIVAPPGRTA